MLYNVKINLFPTAEGDSPDDMWKGTVVALTVLVLALLSFMLFLFLSKR